MRHAALGVVLALLAGAVMAPAVAEGGFDWPLPDWMPRPPVPEDNPMSAVKVELGRHLFYDARLSGDGTVACASCHDPARAFTDGRDRAVGIHGTVGNLNAPSLANVAYLPVNAWANPHMTSLEFQALVPLFGDAPDEMGATGQESRIFATLATDPNYSRAFAAAFPDRPGRIEITGEPGDARLFRTPSLRNVAVTAPYMHDGSISDLRGVLAHYARGGREGHANQDGMIVGFQASEAEIDDILAFLNSLTDETFLTTPAHADPWPDDHPARINRADP